MVESAAIHGTAGPARLGRSAAGFIEATAAEPERRYRAAARVRMTDSAVGAEAPFAGGRGSVLFAGRYSYTRTLVALIAPEFSLNYWDYQSRITYDLDQDDRIELLSFGGGDRSSIILDEEPREDLFYGSVHRGALRFVHEREDGGRDRFGLHFGHDRWDWVTSHIRPHLSEVGLRAESSRPLGAKSWLEFGADFMWRFQTDQFFERRNFSGESERDAPVTTFHRNDAVGGTWGDVTWAPSESTALSFGLRFDLYGSGDAPLTEPAARAAVGPRFSLSHQALQWLRLHNSFGFSSQPRSPAQRPPGRMLSVDGGLEHAALSDAGVEFSLPGRVTLDATAFHSAFFNTGDSEQLQYLLEQEGTDDRAQGSAVGLELSLQRMLAKRLRGFLSYTLSRSMRSIGRVRGRAAFDRPHVIDAALAYDFGQGWSLTSRGTYYTGYPAEVRRVSQVEEAPRARDHYQVDWQAAKRWELGAPGAWWGITAGVLNTNLRSESNGYYCDPAGRCQEDLVGPATIPTIGVEGEL
jgi:hypothetical protein